MAFGYCYDPARKCTGNAQTGTRVLRDTIDASVPDVGDLGVYNCRSTRGGSTLSLHGEGRAWDAAIPQGKRALGDRLAAFLVASAQELGIQRVIWWRRTWDSRGRAWRAYGGQSPHTDHVHVELCWKAALNLTSAMVRAALRKRWDGSPEIEEEVGAVFYIKSKQMFQVVSIPGKGGRSVLVGRGEHGSKRKKALEGAGVKIITGKAADGLAAVFPVAT